MRLLSLWWLLCLSLLPAVAASRIAPQAAKIAVFAARPIVFEPAPARAGAAPTMLGKLPGAVIRMSPGHLEIRQTRGQKTTLHIAFSGANRSVGLRGLDRTAGETNYLIGRNPANWRVHVPNFQRVESPQLYPGIDAVFYGNRQHLENDFVVHPGADYHQIRMHLGNPARASLEANGDLRLLLHGSALWLHRPAIYQIDQRDRREPVPGAFRILRNGDVAFTVGHYDARRDLIIDPVLTFSTYLAATPSEVNHIAVDSTGATYVTGTGVLGYPVTQGAFAGCTACAQNEVVTFISKYSPDGKTLIYSTLLGGSQYAEPFGIAVNAAGQALITGYTQSADFPVKNGQKVGTFGNAIFGFLTSLSADGSSLVYSTLLGGNGERNGPSTISEAIALDSAGDAFISGTTDSSVFPITPGALEAVTPEFPETPVFLSKFDPTGKLLYSAILGDAAPQNGGGGQIGVSAVAVDSSGNAYVAGQAGSLWPITQGAFQAQIAGAQPYAAPFVTKVAPDGASLIYSTFFGNGSQNQLVGIAVVHNGDLWLAGIDSGGSGLPTSTGAYQSAVGGTFLGELDASGSNLLYSTYLGAPGVSASAMALDADGDLWIAGQANSLMALAKPLQSWMPLSGMASFVAQFNPTAQNMKFSTYLGGTASGSAMSLALDTNHRAHVSGIAVPGMYTTPGVYQGQVPASTLQNSSPTYGYIAVIDPAVDAPALCIAPNTGITWGNVADGTTVDQTITLANCGTLPLTIDSIQTTGSAFAIPPGKNQCPESLAVGQTCTAAIRFAPTAVAAYNATVTISTNDPVPEAVLPLKGNGTAPKLTLLNSPIFDYALVGQTTQPAMLAIRNMGGASLTIDFTRSTTTGDFKLAPSQLCPQQIPPAGGCEIPLLFTPTKAGERTGSVQIASNDPDQPVTTVALAGTGYSAAPVPEITYVDSPILAAGSTSATLQVSGFGFLPSSIVEVRGQPQKTTYSNVGWLSATLDPAVIPTSGYGEIPVTVLTPSPGGGVSAPYALTVYQEVHTGNAGLVYDPVSQKLFASIPARAQNNANTVLPIDPGTATPGVPIPVGHDPGVLAASADGKYLYVASNGDHTIQRINLDTKAVERTFPLPQDPSLGETTVSDMHVVPGSSTEVVATLAAKGSSSGSGIAMFNDSGLVSYIPEDFMLDGINTTLPLADFAFTSDPGRLYAMPFDLFGTSPFFTVLTLDASGLHYARPSGGTAPVDSNSGDLVASDGSLLYTNRGEVWNPATEQLLHTYAVGNTLMDSVVPDPASGSTYFLDRFGQFDQYGALMIRAFNQSSLVETGDLALMLSPGVAFPASGQLVRWGASGFAFRYDDSSTGIDAADDGIVMLTSKIAAGTGNLNPAPAATALSPASAPAAGADFTLTVSGSGFVPGSTVEWNGTPRITVFLSSSRLTGTIYASDIAAEGSAKVTVASPGPGGGVSLALPFAVSAPTAPSPKLTVTPGTLNFPSQQVGTTSDAQSITVANTGLADATGFAVALTGTDAAGFSETNNCSSTIAAGASCSIQVAFAPQTAGAGHASLSLSFHEAASPVIVSIAGTGTGTPAFSVTPQSGSGGTATVTAGQPASYALVLTPAAGYSGTLSLSCSNLPADATCSFTPSSVNITKGQQPVTITVTVNTSQTQSAALMLLIPSTTALLGFCCLPFWWKRRGWKAGTVASMFAIALVAAACIAGCGGGGGSAGGGSTPPASSPAVATVAPGTYSIQVSISDGTTTIQEPLTLVVQ